MNGNNTPPPPVPENAGKAQRIQLVQLRPGDNFGLVSAGLGLSVDHETQTVSVHIMMAGGRVSPIQGLVMQQVVAHTLWQMPIAQIEALFAADEESRKLKLVE